MGKHPSAQSGKTAQFSALKLEQLDNEKASKSEAIITCFPVYISTLAAFLLVKIKTLHKHNTISGIIISGAIVVLFREVAMF